MIVPSPERMSTESPIANSKGSAFPGVPVLVCALGISCKKEGPSGIPTATPQKRSYSLCALLCSAARSRFHCQLLTGEDDSCVRLAEEVDEERVGCHARLLEAEDSRPTDEVCATDAVCDTCL